MHKGNHKIFLDRRKLYLMVNLRMIGFSFKTLGVLFNCHYTSAKDRCELYGLPRPERIYGIDYIVSGVLEKITPPERQRWEVINGERISLGKNYADYFRR